MSASPTRASAAAAAAASSRRAAATRRTAVIGGAALAGAALILLLHRRGEGDGGGSRPLLTRGGGGEPASSSSSFSHAPPVKQGAGLVLWRDDADAVLLLQRRSRHHDRAWGLPGGNVERSDLSLLDAAEREATEEMGALPSSFSVLTRIDAVRGKGKKGKGEKAYSAFVLRVPGEVAEAFRPVLNKESRSWRWVGREEAFRLTAAGGGGGSSSGGGGGSDGRRGAAASFTLHPVAADLLTPGTQSRALLDEAVSAASSSGGGGGGGGGGGDGNATGG